MLSTCCLKFPMPTDIQNNDTDLISCYQTHVSSCPELVNEITLFHRRFGHPHTQILLHLLKHVPSINLSNKSIKQVLQYICEAYQLGKNHKLIFQPVKQKHPKFLSLFTLICGVLHLFFLETAIPIISALLMILADTHGSIL